jgi:hypothetical protein|tara:strand:- start:224 stop:508 length:285 start_codon:yes stop_codon:yes gene_type:complete
MGKEKKIPNNTKVDPHYIFSYDDLLALNKLITLTYAFDIKVSSEKRMPNNIKKFTVFAPSMGKDKHNMWCSGDGFSVAEAVESWIQVTADKEDR